MFQTPYHCPVCNAVLDTLMTQTATGNAMSEAMLLGEARRDHGRANPECTKDERWIRGWTAGKTVEVPG